MGSRWVRIVGALGLLASATVALANPRFYKFMVPFRSGEYRLALPDIRAALNTNPDDADLHAYLGTAYARVGSYGDALPEFAFSLGSDIYEEHGGLTAHADSLRATGHPEEAVKLRNERIITLASDDASPTLFLGMVDDYRWAGDPWKAEDAAWQAIGISPRSQVAYGYLADAQIDAGELDDARFTLWLSSHFGDGTLRNSLAEARIAMIDGDYEEADRVLRDTHRKRWKSHRLAAMQAEILRREGLPEEAIATIDVQRLPDKDRPEMISEMAAAYADMGDLKLAKALRDREANMYPRDPDVLASIQIVDRDIAKAKAATPPKP